MTKDEYNKRLVRIQTENLEKTRTEDTRHNVAIGHNRNEFRAAVAALREEFMATADAATLMEMGTALRPA